MRSWKDWRTGSSGGEGSTTQSALENAVVATMLPETGKTIAAARKVGTGDFSIFARSMGCELQPLCSCCGFSQFPLALQQCFWGWAEARFVQARHPPVIAIVVTTKQIKLAMYARMRTISNTETQITRQRLHKCNQQLRPTAAFLRSISTVRPQWECAQPACSSRG